MQLYHYAWFACVACSTVVLFQSTTVAGEAEQVNALEKVATQLEQLNESAKSSIHILEQIKDSNSADKATKPLAAASRAYSTESDALVTVGAAADKLTAGGRAGRSAEFQARYDAAGKRIAAGIKEWSNQATLQAKEVRRITELKGLPEQFWNEFDIANVRFGVSLNKTMQALGEQVDATKEKYMSDLLALYEKHGASKVVTVGLVGGGKGERAAAEKGIQNTLGPAVTIVGLSDDNGRSLAIAPVEKLGDVVKAIKIGNVIDQDESRRRIVVQMTLPGKGINRRFRPM